MIRLPKAMFVFGLLFLMTGLAQGAEPWRHDALRAATHLGETIETLDESLHDAFAHQSTPAFKKAIEDIHHIEDVTKQLSATLLTAAFNDLCQTFHHLYEDLVQIRLDLIALGLQNNPQVVNNWNNMAAVYNNELNRFFGSCPPHHTDEASVFLDLL